MFALCACTKYLMGMTCLIMFSLSKRCARSCVHCAQKYLMDMTSISSMIVSHDSKFLDTVCTHIIHYENRKLKNYRGNLSEFVARVPSAASYYSLEASSISWKFPAPGYLEGVKTKDKAILKMTQMSFTYPGCAKPQLEECSLQVRGPCAGAATVTVPLLLLFCDSCSFSAGLSFPVLAFQLAFAFSHSFARWVTRASWRDLDLVAQASAALQALTSCWLSA